MPDNNNLDPSVIAFKTFINKHPALIEEVRRQGRSWQEYYEKWVLLDEEDPFWDQYKTQSEDENETKGKETKAKEKHTELFSQLIKMSENIDIDKVQEHVHQLSNTISTVQEVITQFQQSKKSTPVQDKTINWLRD